MIQNKLSTNIEGVNLINKLTIDELNHLIPQLKKYIGQKIMTLQGKSKKFVYTHHIPTSVKYFRCYLDISNYSIWLKCDTTLQTGEFSVTYYDTNVYIGKMKEGVLIEINEVSEIVKNWNLEGEIKESEVLEQIAQYKAAKEKMTNLEANFRLNKSILKY